MWLGIPGGLMSLMSNGGDSGAAGSRSGSKWGLVGQVDVLVVDAPIMVRGELVAN
jgi:hypothetical protein